MLRLQLQLRWPSEAARRHLLSVSQRSVKTFAFCMLQFYFVLTFYLLCCSFLLSESELFEFLEFLPFYRVSKIGKTMLHIHFTLVLVFNFSLPF